MSLYHPYHYALLFANYYYVCNLRCGNVKILENEINVFTVIPIITGLGQPEGVQTITGCYQPEVEGGRVEFR
jgi:hypothetical protein